VNEPVRIFDEELSQSKARITHATLYAGIYLFLNSIHANIHAATIANSLTITATYLVFSVIWYIWVKRTPFQWPARRYISLFTDMAIITTAFHILGKNSAIGYPLFLWVIVGNGIRYGQRYLMAGILLGVVGFASIVQYAPFWRDNTELSIGLLAGAIILPLFFLKVLRRLQILRQLEIELDRSRQVDQAKDKFLSTMSHELRTPINAIMGVTESLVDNACNSAQKEKLQIINRSVESLLHTITGVLDYSEISNHRLVLDSRPFDLQQALQEIQKLMAPAATEKGLKLHFEYHDDLPRFFDGDPNRICQIVFNLVGNAIKFTQNGQVTISCQIAENDGAATINLTVTDTGIGVAEDCCESIFEHFEQVDGSNTRQFEGVGLGLTISRKLAQLMGGDVTVASEVGVGSSFTARIQLKECLQPAPVGPSVPEALPNYGMRALVAEDNKFNQVVIVAMLKKIGITCVVADDGRQAVDLISQQNFDLVFMDIRMPIMNGYDATETIRARNDGQAEIPILAVTGETTQAGIAKCMAVGMNLFMSKPVKLSTLIESIDSLEIAMPAQC